MNDNLNLWNKVKKPPEWALKTIGAGRLKGKSDINPQWRIQAMTENFGVCGIGWKYVIDKLWTENGTGGEVTAWALVSVYIKDGAGVWSEAIQGVGGNSIIIAEKAGLHTNDEAYKMAVTDALSVAFRFLGVGADIYQGRFDTKYESKTEAVAREYDQKKAQEPPKKSDPSSPDFGKELFDKGKMAIVKAGNNDELKKLSVKVAGYLSDAKLTQAQHDELQALINELTLPF